MTDAARFWSKVDRRGDDECWPWKAGKVPTGYGMIRFNKQHQRAHRVAWQLAWGPIPSGLLVCHHCDNPGCCNPLHLFLGTDKDNIQDAAKKGRMKGPRKLNNLQIRIIHHLLWFGLLTQTEIAEPFGVKNTTASNIKGKKKPVYRRVLSDLRGETGD